MATRAGLAIDSIYFTNISATVTAFQIRGGMYGITVSATFGGGSITLQKLAADDTTYVTISTYSAAAFETQNLPAGTYRFGVTTATAIYIDMTSVLTTE